MSDALGAVGARPLARGRAEHVNGREPVRDGEPGAARSPVAFAALLHASLQPKAEGPVQNAGGAVQNAEDAELNPTEGAELGEGVPDSATSAAPPSAPSAVLPAERREPSAESTVPSAVHRGTETLVPEMRARLDRVIERMREEHGHSVTVVETYRSQDRQDQLHAQGRTAPGPVVTWTRSSRHTLGRAADVMVNGTYDDPKAYATLQRIAREEGLRTLGARDAGHLELPAQVPGRGTPDGRAAADALPLAGNARAERIEVAPAATTPAAKPATSPPPANGVAPVATVAQVAAVAHVARVAQVAAPGAARPAARPATVEGSGDASRGRGTVQRTVAGAHGRETALAAGGRVAAVETREQRIARLAARAEQEKEAGAEGTLGELLGGAAEEQARGVGGEGRQSALASTVRAADAAQPAQGIAGADAIARLDRIEALREGAAARPLSHITLRIDGADGTEDRIRVDLRGNTLGASLELSDAALVERVGARIGELQQALERQGLEAEALQVRRGAAAVPEAIETARVASVLLEREAARGAGSQHTGSNGQGQQQQHGGSARDQRDGRPSPDTPSRDQSDPRHRSRREPKGER